MMDHIQECARCRQKYEQQVRFNQAISASQHRKVPNHITDGFWDSVRAEIVVESSEVTAVHLPKRCWRPALIWGIPSFAAACLIAFFIFMKTQPFPERRSYTDSTLLDVAVYSAQIDGQDAQVSIFHTSNPEMTFVWLDK
jgi:hypothetical protein